MLDNDSHAGEDRVSLAEDRSAQVQDWWKAWQQVKAGAPRSGAMSDEERKELVVSKLVELCTEEIVWALNEDLAGRVFCNVWLVVDYKHSKAGWFGDASVLRAGISRALCGKLDDQEADIVTHIRNSVAQELADCRDKRIKKLRGRKATEILPDLLELTSRNPHNAAVFTDHLTNHQRSDLKALLHDQLSDKSVIHIRMNQEPEEPRMWLYWYLYYSEVALPENKRKMRGIPRDLLAIRRGAVRANKHGEIIMPLGPMYAKVFEKQKSELNRLRRRPKNPGVNKIAESLGVGHDTATRWLNEDVPVKLEPNGNGGVYYTFNLDTIQRCIEITAGKKRGPKSGHQ